MNNLILLKKNIVGNADSKKFKNGKCLRNSQKNPEMTKFSKNLSDSVYRLKMRNHYKKLGYIIIGNNSKLKKKDLLELAVKYIDKVENSNDKLILENERLKKLLESNDENEGKNFCLNQKVNLNFKFLFCFSAKI